MIIDDAGYSRNAFVWTELEICLYYYYHWINASAVGYTSREQHLSSTQCFVTGMVY